MNGVKLACGCGIVAFAMAGQLSHLTGVGPPGPQGAKNRPQAGAVGQAAIAWASNRPQVEARLPEMSPGDAARGLETIAPDRFGQFHAMVEIEGQRIPMMVDTGASYVTLSFEDADRLGIRPLPADFKYKASTANGISYLAQVEIRDIRLNTIEVRNVTAFVSARGVLSQSLLGMSFLTKLAGFRVDGGELVLKQ